MEAKQALEIEYTPSLFSKRFENRDELFANYIEFTTKESEKVRHTYNCRLNIAYGSTFRQKLDIYGDDLSADSPLLVFVHGGYWQMCDKWGSSYLAGPLVESGVRVIVVDHELCPTVSLQEVVLEIKESFKWISDYVKKNSIKSVSFAGHSAGAHLLACALDKNFIDSIAADVKIAAYAISGIYDLQELRHLNAANEKNILSLDDSNFRQLSPQFHDFSHLESRSIIFFVFVGEFESEKFKQQSRDFAENALKKLKSISFEILSGVDHFDIVEKLTERDYFLTNLFIHNLKR